jgi:hypothetical protein
MPKSRSNTEVILHIYEDEVFVGVSNIMLIGMHAGLVFTPF